jgi:hypothetical protein
MSNKVTSILITAATLVIASCTHKVTAETEITPETVDNSASAVVSSLTYDVMLTKPTSSTGATRVAQYEAKTYVFQNPVDVKQLDINNVPVSADCTSTTACKVSTSNLVSLSQSGYVIEVYIDGVDVGSSTANGNATFLVNTSLPRHACQNVGLGTIAGSTNAGYEVNYWGRTPALVGGGALAYKVWNGSVWVNAKFKKNIYGKYQWMPATSADPQSYSTATATGLSFCD